MNNRLLVRLILSMLFIVPLEISASDIYEVTVTRKDQDLYEVQGVDVYIKTRYCYEYVYYDDAILKIDSNSGFTIGKLIFESGDSCDVAKILN
jgi:hypothetical protein